jgi:hypothetical protein
MPSIPEGILAKLRRPLPARAYQEYNTRSRTLTTVKPAYLIDWLHEAFGIGNVQILEDPGYQRVETLAGGRIILHYRGMLILHWNDKGQEETLSFSLSGLDELLDASKMGTAEDTYKGCRTNAISKAVYENLGLGMPVFKGLLPWQDGGVVELEEDLTPPKKKSEQRTPPPPRQADNLAAALLDWARSPMGQAKDSSGDENIIRILRLAGFGGRRILDLKPEEQKKLAAAIYNADPTSKGLGNGS